MKFLLLSCILSPENLKWMHLNHEIGLFSHGEINPNKLSDPRTEIENFFCSWQKVTTRPRMLALYCHCIGIILYGTTIYIYIHVYTSWLHKTSWHIRPKTRFQVLRLMTLCLQDNVWGYMAVCLNVCTCAEWTVNIVCLPQGVLWTIKVKVTCVVICLFLQVETSVVPALWKEYGKLTKYLISLNGWLNISKKVCDYYEVTLYLHIRVFCFKDWRHLHLWEFIIWTLIYI